MSDVITIPNLLSLLQINPRHRGIQMARESERLCRVRSYDKAIIAAENAARLVEFDYQWQGVVLLYHSHALLSVRRPQEELRAVRECDRAIRGLCQDPYNQALAHVIRAVIELERLTDSDLTTALDHFKQGAHLLGSVATTLNEHNQTKLVQQCRHLQTAISDEANNLLRQLTAAGPMAIAPKQATPVTPAVRPQSTAASPEPTVATGSTPIRVALPTPESLSFEFMPIGEDVVPDAISANRITIHNRSYRIEPITVTGDALALRANQPYLILPLLGARHGQYALVRQQRRPNAKHQRLAVKDPSKSEILIGDAEADTAYRVIHLLGTDRTWTIHDGTETDPYDPDEIIILGVVEAILTPIE